MKNKLLVLICAFGLISSSMVRLSAAPTLGEPVATPATFGLQTSAMQKEYAVSVGRMVRIYNSAKDNKLRNILKINGVLDPLQANVQKINELEDLVVKSGHEINSSFLPLFGFLAEEKTSLTPELESFVNLGLNVLVEKAMEENHTPEAQEALKDYMDLIVKEVNNYNEKYAKITHQLLQFLKQKS